jgi:hypothetical protein
MQAIGVIGTYIKIGLVIDGNDRVVGVMVLRIKMVREDRCKIDAKHQNFWLSDWLEWVDLSRVGPVHIIISNKGVRPIIL